MVLCEIEEFLIDVFPYFCFGFQWVLYPLVLLVFSFLISMVVITPILKVIGRWCIQKAIRLEKRGLLKALSQDYLKYELKEEESVSYLTLTVCAMLLVGCWVYLL